MEESLVYSLFPTCVLHKQKFLTEQECLLILNTVPKNLFAKHNTITGSSVSSHETFDSVIDYIDEKTKMGLKDRISSKISEYISKSGFRKSVVSNSWMNYQYKGSVLEKHTHPMSIVSGALYLKVDDLSSKINFYNPVQFYQYSATDKDNFTPYTFEHVWFQPKLGDLFVFPSWLNHGSNGEQNGSDERVVMSFNTNLG
jgi:uncharacterized protein (TIGR02466 family)